MQPGKWAVVPAALTALTMTLALPSAAQVAKPPRGAGTPVIVPAPAPPRPVLPPPPLIRRPVIAAPAPVAGRERRQFIDNPSCILGARVEMTVDGKEGSGVCLVRNGGVLFITTADAQGTPLSALIPVTVSHAVTILADRQLEPLWPVILDEGGPDLVALRDEWDELSVMLMRNAGNPRAGDTREAAQERRTGAILRYLNTLFESGQRSRAMTELDRHIATNAPNGRRWRDPNQQAWVVFRGQRSHFLSALGRRDEALADLTAGVATPGLDRPLRGRMQAFQAILLNHAGRYADALAATEAAATELQRGRTPLSDADRRMLAETRACALHHLGRPAESAAALTDLTAPSTDPGFNRDLFPDTLSAEARTAICMRDADRLANLLAATGPEFLAGAATMQPALREWVPGDHALFAAVRAAPAMAAWRARWRELPPELHAALNRWPERDAQIAAERAAAEPATPERTAAATE